MTITTLTPIRAAKLFAATAASAIIMGCGSDSLNGPVVDPIDKITVSLNRIYAKYDCDSGLDGAGEFEYIFQVYKLGENGRYSAVKKFANASASLNNGTSRTITNRKVSFELPRRAGQQFKVYIQMKENDGVISGYDFTRSDETVHRYNAAANTWEPVGKAATNGTVSWSEKIRDRKTFIGIVTEEGCEFTASYSVKVEKVS